MQHLKRNFSGKRRADRGCFMKGNFKLTDGTHVNVWQEGKNG